MFRMWNARMDAWYPEAGMEDLLRAVVTDDDRWRESWTRWRESAVLENLPPAAFRLLPLLYRRLRSERIADPWMGKLLGIYRHTWARNQILLRDAAQAASALRDAEIPVMLLKGAAMILSQYHDAGLCPAVDMDILVPDTEISAAIRCLRRAGFSPTGRYEGDIPERFLRIGFSHALRSLRGNETDLHWHMLNIRSFAGADESFWRRAVRADFSGLPVLLPSATDLLLTTCLHGMCWSDTSSLRWVADACTLIRRESIDWERIAACARWRDVALPLRLSLEYLRSGLGLAVPEETLRSIQAVPITTADRRVFSAYAGKETLVRSTLRIWFRHARFSRERLPGLFPLLAGLPSFLADYWAISSIWKVPGTALKKIARRFSPRSAVSSRPSTH